MSNLPAYLRHLANGAMQFSSAGLHEVADGYEALEARVKEQQEKHKVEINGANERCKLLFNAKNHWADRARTAEAELARLKAQEPVGEVAMMDYATTRDNGLVWVTLCVKAEKANRISLNDKMFSAAPRPALLPPEKVAQRSNWSVAQWVEHVGGRYKDDNPLNYVEFGSMQAVGALLKQVAHSASINGYNQAIADAKALGCQPQRVVVKLDPAWWVTQGGEEFLAYPKDKVIAAIKAAGGEIAE